MTHYFGGRIYVLSTLPKLLVAKIILCFYERERYTEMHYSERETDTAGPSLPVGLNACT